MRAFFVGLLLAGLLAFGIEAWRSPRGGGDSEPPAPVYTQDGTPTPPPDPGGRP